MRTLLRCTGLLFALGATISSAQAQTLDPIFANQFEEGAASLAPALSYARVGAGATTGIGAPIPVTLMAPAMANTFVPITSSNPTQLTVVGGGATVLIG